MTDRSILLIITGGVAAFKSLELIRELGRAGVKSALHSDPLSAGVCHPAFRLPRCPARRSVPSCLT